MTGGLPWIRLAGTCLTGGAAGPADELAAPGGPRGAWAPATGWGAAGGGLGARLTEGLLEYPEGEVMAAQRPGLSVGAVYLMPPAPGGGSSPPSSSSLRELRADSLCWLSQSAPSDSPSDDGGWAAAGGPLPGG